MVSVNFPHPALARHVLCYVTHDSFFEELEWHNISARGMPMLIFPYGQPSDSSFRHGDDGSKYPNLRVDEAAFLGSNSVYARCHFHGPVQFVMVIMQMTGGYHFLRQSMKGLANEVVLLGEAGLADEFRELQDRLWETKTGGTAVGLVEEALLSYFDKHPPVLSGDYSPVGDYLMRRGPGLKVAELARKFNCTDSWLERQFADQTGLSPKTWIRLHRFRQAASYRECNPGSNWMDIVAMFGYTDQSHLNRDFKEFAGNAPAYHFEHFGDTEKLLHINNPGVLVPGSYSA